jgi:8-oxo-dGTP diphosphatase
MREATLCHPLRGAELLLIRKQRGPGAGNLVAPGGKIEDGETPRECAVRETREEVGLHVQDLDKRGELRFVFGEEPFMFVHVFLTRDFRGRSEETAEAVPQWVDTDDLPYEEMWDDDRYWLPLLLDGQQFRGEFFFDSDGEAVLEYDLVTGLDF